MTSTEHVDHVEHVEHEHHEDSSHKSNAFYIQVAVALAVVTGVEVGIYYLDIGKAYMPVLLILMAIKFLTVVSVFMHLKFDNKIFSYLFYAGLLLAIAVYFVALMTFHFFAS